MKKEGDWSVSMSDDPMNGTTRAGAAGWGWGVEADLSMWLVGYPFISEDTAHL